MFVLCIKLLGAIFVIGGSFFLGINICYGMNKRIRELKELERIYGMLDGELRFRHNPIRTSFANISSRCSEPFCLWINKLCEELDSADGSLVEIWERSLEHLQRMRKNSEIFLSKEDINDLIHIGQALSESNVEAGARAILLEKDMLHHKICELDHELKGKKKVALSVSSLGGIMLVILLTM